MNQQQPNNNNDHHNDFPPNLIIIPPEEEDIDPPEEEEGGGEEYSRGEHEGEGLEGESEGEESDSHRTVPPELQMTGQEEEWVWNLMKWMERDDPDCLVKSRQTQCGKVPTDFEYALHAIIAKGNKETADRRIRAMQKFRKKYNVQDTVEEGVRAFQDFIQLQPGFLLHVDTAIAAMGGSGSQQGGLVVLDHSKYFVPPPHLVSSDENARIFLVFFYYLFQICGALNFPVLRGGVRFLVESTGMDHRNMDVALAQQLFQDLFVNAPIQWKEICVYNTSDLITTFIDLLRHYMSDEMRDSISVGCRVEVASQEINDPTGSPALNRILNAVRPNPPPRLTLPELFLQPNHDAAMQNLMTKVRTLLEERYRNEELFCVW